LVYFSVFRNFSTPKSSVVIYLRATTIIGRISEQVWKP